MFLKYEWSHIIIIGATTPLPKKGKVEGTDKLYIKIQKITDKHTILIMGDMNAELRQLPHIVGMHGEDPMNENGVKFAT